jgi:protein-disulfide isomerase
MHKLAFKASEVTHCAGEQGQYWEMHDRLFANQRKLEPWTDHASALGLDVDAFQKCLDTGKFAGQIRQDMALARKAGATGTPSFVLGKTDPEDPNKITGIQFIRGAQPFSTFKTQIDRALQALDQ